MRLTFPPEVRQLPIGQPELAVHELTAILGELRDGALADLETIATASVDAATEAGACLLAVVTPPDAAAALLTGVVLDVPPSWDEDTAEALRDALEDVGGPDVRETTTLPTGLGPAVLAQRVPGIEQARQRQPLTVRLQAFVPEPGSGRMLLLTLAGPSPLGWASHQELFAALVASAGPDQPGQVEPVPAQPTAAEETAAEDGSFEERTYRL